MMVTSAQALAKFGPPEDETGMNLWTLPEWIWTHIPTIPRNIYCNRQLVLPLEMAFLNVIDRGLAGQIRTWDGCFNIRKKRGLKSASLHSWGLAIDINAAWNGLGKVPTVSPELVKCFTDAGFDWGGEWSRPDGMHFQLAYLK